jgi:hypothetical protein
MPRIKLNFRGLTISEKVARSRQIVAALTGNSQFPTPHPPLAQLTAAIDDLDAANTAAQVARQEAKSRTAALNIKEAEHDQLMMKLVSFVDAVAGDDSALVTSIGLEMRDSPNPAQDVPPAPAGLTATDGDFNGEVDLAWDRVQGARSYVVQCSPDPPNDSSWTHAKIATRSQITVANLSSGSRHWFRVAAVGTRGQSAWSNPVMKMVQ